MKASAPVWKRAVKGAQLSAHREATAKPPLTARFQTG